MKSSLDINEFRIRLKQVTSEENAFYFLTPYNSSGTPFCGRFDLRSFELTRNSFWRHVKAIVIRGEYNGSVGRPTDVAYEIGWTKFTKGMFIAFNVILFIGSNTFVLFNRNNTDYTVTSIVLTLNGFLLFGNLTTMLIQWITKRIIDQRFRDEFEIAIEGE